MMREAAAWRKISVRRAVGMAPDFIRSASTDPGPTEGSWSTSPTRSTAACVGTARSNWFIRTTSTMDTSSTTTRSASSGEYWSRRKPISLGSNSSSRWMVLASSPVDSVRRLAARPVGAHSRTLGPLGPQDAQDAVDHRGLAHPGPAGDDPDLAGDRHGHGSALGLGQGEPSAALDPGDGKPRVQVPPGRGLVPQPPQARHGQGHALFGPIQRGEEQGRAPVDGLGHQVALGQFGADRLGDDGGGDLQELAGGLLELLVEGGAVAVAGDLLEGVAHPGLGPDQGVVGYP